MNVPILAYHNIDKRSEWGINTVSPSLFEKQIRFLAEEGYRTISLFDHIAGAVDDKSIIITFDDAYEGVLSHAFPVLERYGMSATIFVISDYVGSENLWDNNLGGRTFRHLSWSGLERLVEAGWEIGSHTATHRDLLGLAHSDLRDELVRSREVLEGRLGIHVQFISYPFNRVDATVIRMAEFAGYKGGCSMTNRRRLSREFANYVIARRGVYAIDLLPIFRQKIVMRGVSRIFDLSQRVISACSMGSILYRRLQD